MVITNVCLNRFTDCKFCLSFNSTTGRWEQPDSIKEQIEQFHKIEATEENMLIDTKSGDKQYCGISEAKRLLLTKLKEVSVKDGLIPTQVLGVLPLALTVVGLLWISAPMMFAGSQALTWMTGSSGIMNMISAISGSLLGLQKGIPQLDAKMRQLGQQGAHNFIDKLKEYCFQEGEPSLAEQTELIAILSGYSKHFDEGASGELSDELYNKVNEYFDNIIEKKERRRQEALEASFDGLKKLTQQYFQKTDLERTRSLQALNNRLQFGSNILKNLFTGGMGGVGMGITNQLTDGLANFQVETANATLLLQQQMLVALQNSKATPQHVQAQIDIVDAALTKKVHLEQEALNQQKESEKKLQGHIKQYQAASATSSVQPTKEQAKEEEMRKNLEDNLNFTRALALYLGIKLDDNGEPVGKFTQREKRAQAMQTGDDDPGAAFIKWNTFRMHRKKMLLQNILEGYGSIGGENIDESKIMSDPVLKSKIDEVVELLKISTKEIWFKEDSIEVSNGEFGFKNNSKSPEPVVDLVFFDNIKTEGGIFPFKELANQGLRSWQQELRDLIVKECLNKDTNGVIKEYFNRDAEKLKVLVQHYSLFANRQDREDNMEILKAYIKTHFTDYLDKINTDIKTDPTRWRPDKSAAWNVIYRQIKDKLKNILQIKKMGRVKRWGKRTLTRSHSLDELHTRERHQESEDHGGTGASKEAGQTATSSASSSSDPASSPGASPPLTDSSKSDEGGAVKDGGGRRSRKKRRRKKKKTRRKRKRVNRKKTKRNKRRRKRKTRRR